MMKQPLIFLAVAVAAATLSSNLCCAQNLCEIKLQRVIKIEQQTNLILEKVEEIHKELDLMRGSQDVMMEQFKNVSTSLDRIADVDECLDGSHKCHRNATCKNNIGSYSCSCSPGFSGDGFNCEDTRCASPYIPIPELGCVREVKENKDFQASSDFCENEGARLLEGITSRELMDDLGKHFEESIKAWAWIGLKKLKWMEGGDGVNMSPEVWDASEPNEGSEECGILRFPNEKVMLADCPCGHTHHFLCQREI